MRKAIIFDLDGTLADTMPTHLKACKVVFGKMGYDFPEDYFYAMAGVPTEVTFKDYLTKINLNHDAHQLAIEKENTFLELLPEVKALDKVAEIARSNKGIVPMAVGSGGTKEVVEKTLKNIGFENFFDTIVTFEDVKNPKPHPDTFLLCAEKLNIEPADCVVYEDADLGIEAAKRAGMAFVDVREM
ncbi:MAG: HAD-IA family hydrolase [Cytophagales bacterium]